VVHQRDRYRALKRIADYYPGMYAIVFCRTRQETRNIAEWLIRDGYNADALHGELTQAQRDSVMQKFRNRNLQMMVATDVAARGLDVNDLTHVINYNPPDDLSSYTHRSGRTGRAGKNGISVLILNMRERGAVRRIEKIIRKKFKQCDLPSGRDICEAQLFHMIEKMKTVSVDEEQIATYLPDIYAALEDMSKQEIIKRFVALEFNHLLDYYRRSDELKHDAKSRRGRRASKDDRPERGKRTGRQDRAGRSDRRGKSERTERSERKGKFERYDRSKRPGKPGRTDRSERREKPERSEVGGKPERRKKAVKSDRSEQPERSDNRKRRRKVDENRPSWAPKQSRRRPATTRRKNKKNSRSKR
jgi:ATP-dependent RNA helicase DeaD